MSYLKWAGNLHRRKKVKRPAEYAKFFSSEAKQLYMLAGICHGQSESNLIFSEILSLSTIDLA